MFKWIGTVLGGFALIGVAAIVPGAAVGLPLLGAAGVLTWFGGVAAGTTGAAAGLAGGAILDKRERKKEDQQREDKVSEEGALCVVKILVAAATCDGPMNASERKAILNVLALDGVFRLGEKRATLDSLLASRIDRAMAVEMYHKLKPFGEEVQRFTLDLVNAVLFADANAVADTHLHAEEKAFRDYWVKLTARDSKTADHTEPTHETT